MNTAELRMMLLRDLADFRAGKMSGAQLRHTCAAVRGVCDTLKIEMAAAAMSRTTFSPVMLTDDRPSVSLAA